MPMNRQEIEMLREEIELLMQERNRLLKVVGAAALLVANTDPEMVQEEAIDDAERLSELLNALPEETLKDALEAVQAEGQ